MEFDHDGEKAFRNLCRTETFDAFAQSLGVIRIATAATELRTTLAVANAHTSRPGGSLTASYTMGEPTLTAYILPSV